MILQIGDFSIPVSVLPSKGRSISLKLNPNKLELIVRSPGAKIGEREASFIRSKERWIKKNLPFIRDQISKRTQFIDNLNNNQIPYLGFPHQLNLESGNKRSVKVSHGNIFIKGASSQNVDENLEVIQKAFRSLAKNYLCDRTFTLASQCQLSVNKVFIKDHKSKWGSCSSKNNINLNWHSIFLPESIITYLIIHELMHLHEMNHSKAYWAWVEKYYPNYKQAQKQLNEYSWIIGVLKRGE